MRTIPDRVGLHETTVLIADPPWPHANGSRTNSGKSPKYPLMTLAEIEALGPTVQGLAGDHAVLYLWITGPHLPGGVAVVNAWGFQYRSFHVWAKDRIACGFWSRSNTELVLVGERGRPTAPAPQSLPTSLFTGRAVQSGHSSKPTFLHDSVGRMWPSAFKIELFARTPTQGWATYGSDLGTVVTAGGIKPVDL